MRLLRTVCAVSLLFSSTGCLTGRVAKLAEHTGRNDPEVLTVTTRAADPGGVPFAVVALEAECRVTPGDPEGGPGARAYTLRRRTGPEPAADEKRLLEARHLTFVSSYERRPNPDGDPSLAVPEGFPDRVIVGERSSGDARVLLGGAGGWQTLDVARYVHQERAEGHPVLAGLEVGVLFLPAMVVDLATFPIQWLFIAPWYPLIPE